MSNTQGGDAPTDAVASMAVEAVANVRLLAFWKQSPQLWFAHAESVFANQRVASNTTKVNFVVGALDEEGEDFAKSSNLEAWATVAHRSFYMICVTTCRLA